MSKRAGHRRAVEPALASGGSKPAAGLLQLHANWLNQTLLLLAETIVAGLGFEVAVVNLVESDGSLSVAAVAGPQSTRDLLLGAS
ncbi:MAG: hypothetical protein NVSMB55_07960 [Mycobacteriales bacterium]